MNKNKQCSEHQNRTTAVEEEICLVTIYCNILAGNSNLQMCVVGGTDCFKWGSWFYCFFLHICVAQRSRIEFLSTVGLLFCYVSSSVSSSQRLTCVHHLHFPFCVQMYRLILAVERPAHQFYTAHIGCSSVLSPPFLRSVFNPPFFTALPFLCYTFYECRIFF